MNYTVKKLADIAGISVRTLHYYDQIGLLKPKSRSNNGYRRYDESAVIQLQQIMFFRELGFGLGEIREIVTRPNFNVLDALKSHRSLLLQKNERIGELLDTIDKTIKQLRGELSMQIKEYYQGFNDEQIEKYRREVKERWGEKALEDSEARVLAMGKEKFSDVQAEGDVIFRAIAENMPKGYDSAEVREQIVKWRKWLENFHTYSDEAVLGLAQTYSRHPEFASYFQKYHPDLPAFFTRAVESYFRAGD